MVKQLVQTFQVTQSNPSFFFFFFFFFFLVLHKEAYPNRKTGRNGNILVRIIGETPRNLGGDDLNAIEQIKKVRFKLTLYKIYVILCLNNIEENIVNGRTI